jgi:hypothetical protein
MSEQPDQWQGQCPVTWDEVSDAAKHAVLIELRVLLKRQSGTSIA